MRSNPHYQRPNQLKTSQEQAHNTLKRIFGADKVKDIEEQTELTQIASEETSLLIDSYAQKQLNKADIFEAKAKLEANPEQAEELRQQASNIRDSWQKGSAQRRFVTAIASGVLGGNIHDTLQQAATNTIGAEAAKAIGEAADKGDINRATQLIAHAALGCGLGSTRDGHCSSGAVGAVAGELTAEVVLKTRIEQLLKEAQENHLSETEVYARLDAIKDEGADLGALAGALSAYATGGDAVTGGKTGQNAAHNNALCGGVCIAAAAAIITYVTVEGDGNPMAGLEHIGAGEDPLSKALASTTQEAVELSYEHFPEATQATLEVLSMAGDNMDATVTYMDEKTGKTVSSAWNSLDEATQNRIMGGAIVVSVFLPATSVTSIKQIKLADGKVGEVVYDDKPSGLDGGRIEGNGEGVESIPSTQTAQSTNTPKNNTVSEDTKNNVVEGETGTFGELSPRSVKDGLTPDHIPSFAAVKENLSRSGVDVDSLSNADIRALRNNTNCIVVKTCDHQQFSRTFGGRNNRTQIQADAANLHKAANADLDTWEPVWRKNGWSDADISRARKEVHELNRQHFEKLGIPYGTD